MLYRSILAEIFSSKLYFLLSIIVLTTFLIVPIEISVIIGKSTNNVEIKYFPKSTSKLSNQENKFLENDLIFLFQLQRRIIFHLWIIEICNNILFLLFPFKFCNFIKKNNPWFSFKVCRTYPWCGNNMCRTYPLMCL